MFFRTDDGRVVLIDITGSANQAKAKARKMNKAIQQYEDATADGEGAPQVHGVVLAPADQSKSERSGDVDVVCGSVARDLLGGLDQLFYF